jgi:hypothetical protein
MDEIILSVSEAGLHSWKEAVLAYKSQLPVLGEALETPEKARESIQSYWGRCNGIRLFHSR